MTARERAKKLCLIAFERPPPRLAHHHVDVPAAAPRAHPPCAPFGDRRLGTIPAGLLGRVGLTAVITCFAPDEETELSGSRASERHRRTAVGFHRGRRKNDLMPGFPIVNPM